VVDSVLTDYARAPISAKEKSLFQLIEIVAADPKRVTGQDVARVRAAGWSDAAIYDAVTVCALFKFFNTWVDATGVARLSPGGYAESGQRLASCGYLQTSPPAEATP
jgi:hypothetical protein